MVVKETEDVLKRLRRKPLATAFLLVVVLAAVAGGAWVVAYSSEIGKRAAEPASNAAQANATAAQMGRLIGRDDETNPANGGAAEPDAALETNAAAKAEGSGRVAIEQVTIGSGSRQSVLGIAIRNPTGTQILLEEIKLSGHQLLYLSCHSSDPHVYRIDDLAAASMARGERRVTGSFRSASAPEFRYPVSGRYSTSCALRELSLAIQLSVPIESGSIQVVQVVVPNALRFNAHRAFQESVPVQRGETARIGLSVFHELDVRAETSGGPACYTAHPPQPLEDRDMVRRVRPPAPAGPYRCYR